MATDKKRENEGGFFKFLYNSDTGEVLGRTGTSWAKIIVFYIIFYAGLAAFFGLMLYIFYMTLDMHRPKYTTSGSLIGTNPGVGFRPQPDQDANVDSTLIWFKRDNQKEYEFWSNQLKQYVTEAATDKGKTCSFLEGGKAKPDADGGPCKVDTTNLGPCNVANDFGYKTGAPCILIKLNRIFDCEPEQYKDTKPKDYEKEDFLRAIEKQKNIMPDQLREYITKTLVNASVVAPSHQKAFASTVWVSCAGENPADRENVGHIDYYPLPGIPSYYFPFSNQKSYQSPFVMVHFPRVHNGVLINIECKAWAANIFPDRQTRTGSVHFELMID